MHLMRDIIPNKQAHVQCIAMCMTTFFGLNSLWESHYSIMRNVMYVASCRWHTSFFHRYKHYLQVTNMTPLPCKNIIAVLFRKLKVLAQRSQRNIRTKVSLIWLPWLPIKTTIICTNFLNLVSPKPVPACNTNPWAKFAVSSPRNVFNPIWCMTTNWYYM